MRIKFLGAAKNVTGSCIQLSYNKKNYLIDCGLFQGDKDLRQKNWSDRVDVSKIDAVILTHAHIDHSGYIPKLVKMGYKGPIYCTHATQDLCKIMLPDSGKLQEEDADYLNAKKATHYEPALPLYTESDAIESLKYFSPQSWSTWITLDKGISFQFLKSGHILGSAFVQISYQNEHGSKIITFSGDLGNDRSLIINGPEVIRESDYLVVESTYGDRNQPKTDHRFLLKEIIKRVLGRGGTLIIPAFAVGRTQELIYLIHLLESEGLIQKVPVYVDSPMALDATEIYLKHQDELKQTIRDNKLESTLCCSRFTAVRSADESMLLCMSTEPKIVISAAGMLTGGRILHHLKTKLPDEKSGVLFVGHQVEGTKGHILKNGLGTIFIHKKKVDVEAEIFSLESMSAHADSDEIMKWLSLMTNKPKQIFVNHGSANSSHVLKYRIEAELGLKATVPNENDTFDL